MSARFHTSGIDARRLSIPAHRIGGMTDAQRRHAFGPIQPMDRPGLFARLFGKGC
jgi:hypothetical protein